MIPGYNTNIEYQGRMLHVQSECHGEPMRVLKSIVFCSGEVLGVVEHCYLDPDEPEESLQRVLARRLTTQHNHLVKGIQAHGVRPAETARVAAPRRRRVVPLLAALVATGLIALLGHRFLPGTNPNPRPEPEMARVAASPPVLPATPSSRNDPDPPPAVATKAAPESSEPAPEMPEHPPPVTERDTSVPGAGEDDAVGPAKPEPGPVTRSPAGSSPTQTGATYVARITPSLPGAGSAAKVETSLPPPKHDTEPAEPPSSSDPASDPGRIEPTPRQRATPAAVEVTDPYRNLTAVDVAPRPVARELPSYTRRARKKKEQGIVDLELMIDAKGLVADVRLVQGIEGSDLNEAALAAARQWRFAPARLANRPVSVRTPVRLQFSIDSGTTSVRVTD